MRAYIARLHQELGTTTLYVTHDQTEAMTMGDRVAVMRDGRLEQVDTPQRLYEQPANMFVAGFIGSPAMNLLRAVADGDGVLLGDQRLRVRTHATAATWWSACAPEALSPARGDGRRRRARDAGRAERDARVRRAAAPRRADRRPR